MPHTINHKPYILLFWLFIFLFIFDFHFWENNWIEALIGSSLETLSAMLFFYFNYKIAIPYFLATKRYIYYALALIACFMVYYGSLKFTDLEFEIYEGSTTRNFFSMLLNYGLFILISTLAWYYQRLQVERERQLELENEKLATEMKFLKSQISPHFIFNTLNNIYSLVQQKHDNAAPMLAKLSKILRYILYDSVQKKVDLKKELETIEQYISLQLLRKPLSENVDFYYEGSTNGLTIAPLLLLNFVENCFKHSDLQQNTEAWIKITCIIEKDALHFTTENSKQKGTKKATTGGIGNENIQRQLELNYPNQHHLKIEETNDIFMLRMEIERL